MDLCSLIRWEFFLLMLPEHNGHQRFTDLKVCLDLHGQSGHPLKGLGWGDTQVFIHLCKLKLISWKMKEVKH